MRLNIVLILIGLLGGLLLPGRANADIEYWQGFTTLMPLQEESWGKLSFQSFTVAQMAPRFDGIGILRFSNGPVWRPTRFFQLGAYADLIYIEAPAGNPTQEYRLNLEPLFLGNVGEHLRWINRSRVEYRMFPDRHSWRLRNKLRFDLIRTELPFVPFIDNEIFVSPFDKGFDQNRSRIGAQWQLPGSGQSLELAYQWRWRKNAQEVWDSDHILMLFYFFNPPFQEAS